jgi:hypothetical protein
MRVNATRLWCPEGTAPVNHWGHLVGKVWPGLLPPPLNEPILLALRGVRMGASETHEVVSKPDYDDTGALLVPGAEPFVFPMATHPFQARSSASDDGDGDGDGDVATILPGLYVLTLARTGTDPIWTMATNDGKARIPCSRDLNHDGKISAVEAAQLFTASAILLHKGADGGRSSIGCQTASLPVLNVIARAGKVLKYRLVLATDAIAALEEGESQPPPAGVA